MESLDGVFRASLNFTSKCNMGCQYCYIPFSRDTVDAVVVERVLSRLFDIGVCSITIGGGDPLQYPFLIDALPAVRSSFNFIQLDSNLIRLDSHAADTIVRNVDLVGVPLDGPNAQSHGQMRSSPDHFGQVMEAIKLLDHRVSVKINSVLSVRNYQTFLELSDIVAEIEPLIWAIYQFWPIGDRARRFALRFILEDAKYREIVELIRNRHPRQTIESGESAERAGSYFFVNHNGLVYATDPHDQDKYVWLGSVFDADIVKRWLSVALLEKNKSRISERLKIVSSLRPISRD